ncbi:protein of unknown function [Methylorubrum extorquens]|uniref:Uncharacterized protein n=1 Tax=Methylorubrum extorquens TaxID=408 RepID=A0A2N9AVH2_METEX|nr:protein of unknown function [Methylorubrum extorquens]
MSTLARLVLPNVLVIPVAAPRSAAHVDVGKTRPSQRPRHTESTRRVPLRVKAIRAERTKVDFGLARDFPLALSKRKAPPGSGRAHQFAASVQREGWLMQRA